MFSIKIVMAQELGLLLLLVLVAILTYSSLVYFAERDVKVSQLDFLRQLLCHYKSQECFNLPKVE